MLNQLFLPLSGSVDSNSFFLSWTMLGPNEWITRLWADPYWWVSLGCYPFVPRLNHRVPEVYLLAILAEFVCIVYLRVHSVLIHQEALGLRCPWIMWSIHYFIHVNELFSSRPITGGPSWWVSIIIDQQIACLTMSSVLVRWLVMTRSLCPWYWRFMVGGQLKSSFWPSVIVIKSEAFQIL